MSMEYILDENKNPVPARAGTTTAWWEDDTLRRVRFSLKDGVSVSTVFLVLDHRFGTEGPPILFETLVQGGDLDEYMDRYCTWDEAEAGHKAACERAFGEYIPSKHDVEPKNPDYRDAFIKGMYAAHEKGLINGFDGLSEDVKSEIHVEMITDEILREKDEC